MISESNDFITKVSQTPVLPDNWERLGTIPLNGVLERNQFAPLLTALLGLILVFILFQVVIAPIAVVFLMLIGGTPPHALLDAFVNLVSEQPKTLLVANTIGQVLGVALPALFLARLHSTRRWAFLRMRKVDPRLFIISLVSLVALIPLVQWLGQVSDALPWPEFIRAFEKPQLDLIEKVLGQGIGVGPGLLMMALTPALCEELLFRGYIQRQAERSLGVVWGIVITGLIFGLFHLRPTQAIPLSVLGIYLAYITWRTGSLWPAMAVHFANNGFAVILGAYVKPGSGISLPDIDKMTMPWYLVVVALGIFVLLIIVMNKEAREIIGALPSTECPGSNESPVSGGPHHG